jgi:hypothetical protein
VIDFDVAVRDPANPNHSDPRYDGGDGLHFTAKGYRRLAKPLTSDSYPTRRHQIPFLTESRSILLSKNMIHPAWAAAVYTFKRDGR